MLLSNPAQLSYNNNRETNLISQLNQINVNSQDIRIYHSPKEYKQQLLQLIAQAEHRIYITALYLQDDEAGREILEALYQAKQAKPQLEVKVFVDAHRAQRGLIGAKEQLGNRALYLEQSKQHGHSIDIHGVAVKNKELFGVLHLKGMVFDNTLFYTGASINDVYLHQNGKYRLDRYYQIESKGLADSFVNYLKHVFVNSQLAPLLNQGEFPALPEQKKLIHQLRLYLTKVNYAIEGNKTSEGDISIEPLVGFGRRRNLLNIQIRRVIQKSQQELVIFTPYFNLPKVISRDLIKALKRGVKVTITVGDKTANDFYIANQDEFSTIGIIPYIYEILLARFVKRWKKFIDSGQLEVRLWKDESNSFHLKGIIADNRYHLVTGSNINPRAWALDLENGLLLDDPTGSLNDRVSEELAGIYQHTEVLKNVTQLQSVKDYPAKPQKLLKRLRLAQIDKLLKRLL